VAQHVMVVEDEYKLRELLRSYLEREGLDVFSTASGAEALSHASREPVDLVILDLGLPDVPGEVVAREIRSGSDVPILMLTAKTEEQDRVAGLELGADDYVTKPFSPRELVLRVAAILRRGRASTVENVPVSYGNGRLLVDEDRHHVSVDGQTVELTPTEWGVLTILTRVPGRVYSRSELINRVRGYDFEGYERTVDSHVKNLRRKIESDPSDPKLIETVLGAGYRLGVSRDS
jgi:DNA-binding response OmpR family regulator